MSKTLVMIISTQAKYLLYNIFDIRFFVNASEH